MDHSDDAELVEAESYFDRLTNGGRFSIRSDCRTESPSLNAIDRFLVQAHARALHHLNVRGAAIGIDDRNQRYRAHVVRFYGLVRKLRLRAEKTFRDSVAASASAGITAASIPPMPGTNASSVTAANARSLSRANSATTCAIRIGDQLGHGIAVIRQIRALQLDIRDRENRGRHL